MEKIAKIGLFGIVILFLVFSISFISASISTYNFITEANIWVFACDDSENIPPDTFTDITPTCLHTLENCTSATRIESDDGLFLCSSTDDGGSSCRILQSDDDYGWLKFNVTIQENISRVTLINWTGEVDEQYDENYVYMWNYSSGEWYNCEITSGPTVISDCYTTDISDFVDEGGNTQLWVLSQEPTYSAVLADYMYFEVTYTPEINIFSPTTSQIFTEDEPTARFNISTEIEMSYCFYELDSTNFTLTKFNNTWFNMTNTSMIDGSHFVRFWCNDSSGKWYESENVSFDVDSINVTVCRDLTIDRSYTLLNDINSPLNCLNIKNSDIIINANGYSINSTLNTIEIDGDYDNLRILDSNLNGTISISASSTNNTFLNASYWGVVETISGELLRKWYFQTEVNSSDTDSYLQNANVSIYNVTGDLIHSELTDASGSIGKEELIEYINDGTKDYHTPHNITTSKSGYHTNSTIYNLTEEQNIYHYVTLSTIYNRNITQLITKNSLITRTNMAFRGVMEFFSMGSTISKEFTTIKDIVQEFNINSIVERLGSSLRRLSQSFSIEGIVSRFKGMGMVISQIINIFKAEKIYDFTGIFNSRAFNNTVEDEPPLSFAPAMFLMMIMRQIPLLPNILIIGLRWL